MINIREIKKIDPGFSATCAALRKAVTSLSPDLPPMRCPGISRCLVNVS